MKAKRWTALLLSAVLAFSVCMPVSGISTFATEEAAAETTQPAPEESDSVQTESAASAAENLTEESSSEDAPAENGSVVEEEAENAASSDGTQLQENMEDPQEDPVNDAAGEAAQQEGQEPLDAGKEDQEAAPVAGSEQDPDSDGQADSAEASFESEDAAETAAPEQSEAADTVSEGQSEAVDAVSEEQSGVQAEDGQTVITEDSEEEKESVEPTEAAASQETDFESAVEISVGQTLTAEVTEESPYAFFKFTPQENGALSVYSTSESDTYAELFNESLEYLCNDDESGENNNFLLCFECSVGETYYVRARQWNYESCSFDVTLEKPSFYVDHSYGGTLNEDLNTELDLHARAFADTELTYRWYVNDELRQEGASDSFRYLFDQTPATVECRIEDEDGHSDSVLYNIYENYYWDVYPEGDSNVVVENGETCELKVLTEVREGHENDYDFTYTWVDSEGNELQTGTESSYTTAPVNGSMSVICRVFDQHGYEKDVFYVLYNPGWLNVYPYGTTQGASYMHMNCIYGTGISLYVSDGTDGSSPVHYIWYDEEDQVVDGSGDASYCILQEVTNSRTIRCHAEDENGNCADLFFYIHVEGYLTVYPEGVEDGGNYVWIEIMGKDSVDLHTIAENSAGSAVTYQWQKLSYDPQTIEEVWTDIEGATQETYTVGNPLYIGQYRCCVRDADGNSGTANFVLDADTYFSTSVGEDNGSSSITYDARDYSEVTFAPWATSEDPDRITWQWAKLEDGSEKIIDGENGNTYTVVSPQNGDTYVCIVGDGYGRETRLHYYFLQENHLSVTVDEDGREGMDIDPRTADDFTLTPLVTADDMSQLAYKWTMYQDGETEVGDGPSLFIDHKPDSGTEYHCTVTDQFGNSGHVSYYFRFITNLRAWPEGMEKRSSRSFVISGQDKITLTAFAQGEEGITLSWEWYHNTSSIYGEGGSLESTAEPSRISLDVVSPQIGDDYLLEIWDNYGNRSSVSFYFVDEAPALNVYPMGAEEGQDTAVVTYDGTTQEYALLVGVAEPTEPATLFYDWRDSEGNSLGETDSRWIDLHSFTDGARYSCIVTDPYGQSATVWFELRREHGEDDPTEEDMDNASPISVGDSVDVEVTEEAPIAWFRFEPAESGTYELFSTPKSGIQVDTVASLYTPDGNRLLYDDDSAGNYHFSLEYTFEKGETYYFGVRTISKESGSFTIQLVSGEKSEWLKDYEYRIDGDRIILTEYNGETAEITVPGHAMARGKEYSCIVLSPYIWDSWENPVTSLSFEEGVSFPDDSNNLFASLPALTSIDLQNVDMANVKNMNSMFSSCSSLTSIDLGAFNASGVESCEGIFDNCPNLQTINTPTGLQADAGLPAAFLDESGNIYSALPKNLTQSLTLTRASVSENLKDYNYQVDGDKVRLTSYHGENNSVVVPGNVTVAGKTYNTVELTPGMWSESGWNINTLSFEQGVILPADCTGLFEDLWNLTTLDLSGLDWSGVTNMACLFEDCSGLTSLNLSGIDTSNVTNMHRMFSYCSSLTNLDLSSLDTSNVIDMSEMFRGCYGLESLDLDGLDTHSVTNMSEMFCSCGNLKTIDISGFDTAKVTDMSYMFAYCSSLTELNMSGFRTGALTNVRSMFRDCSSLTALDLGSFDASAVEHVSYMVKGCSALATINSPVNLTKTTNLPAVYEGSDGALYGIMPRNQNKSVVLVYSRDLKPGESGDPEALNTVEKAEITLSPASFTYSGTECKPEAKVVFEGKVLTQGTHYTVTYSNNKAAGQAAVTVTGMGIYGGKAVKNFTIAKAALADSGVTVSASGLVYNGKAKTPAVTVKSGSTTLVEGTDYTKAYSNNTNAGKASVTVTGKGNYKGAVTKTFTIAKAAQSITAKAAAATVSVGKTTTVNVTGAKGGLTYSSSNATLAAVTTAGKVTAKKVGSVNITVKAAATANYNAASKTVAIKVVPAATKTLKAANLAKGIKLTWAKVAGANGYIIYRNNKKVKTVGGSAVSWSDTAANTNGTKYVYQVFAKASTGTSTLSKSVTTYCVARPAVSSVSNSASRKMTVKWGKNAKATGYQIQYGLKKNFSGAKTVNVAKAATVSKVIGSLQKGKTYYVRIKTYKKVGTAKYESVWSTAKTVKITK